MITTIKRPLKLKKVKKNIFQLFQRLIEDSNLFFYNIFLFIHFYYIFNLSSYELLNSDILVIFKILRDGRDFEYKDLDFYKFYCQTYEQLYFNPKKTEEKPLICGKNLDQVIQVNAGTILANITNNITINFEKYLDKFITCYMKNKCKDIFSYNSLIKKCSSYECYKETIVLIGLIDLLRVLTIQNDSCVVPILCILSNNLTGKIKKYVRSKNNLFSNELKKIKEYEENFNNQKRLIKKFLLGKINDINEISHDFRDLLEYKKFILPEMEKSFDHDLSKEPFKFVPSMIYINNYLENNNQKTFNVFPKRNNCIPKHVTLDTASINAYFCQKRYKNLCETRNEVWKEVLNFPESYFLLGGKNKNNRLKFSGTIQTDGVSLSLQYKKEDDYDNSTKISKIKQKAKDVKKEKQNDITQTATKIFDEKINETILKIEELNEKLSPICFKLTRKKNLSNINRKKLEDEEDDIIIEMHKLNQIVNDRKLLQQEKIKKEMKIFEENKKKEKDDKTKKYKEMKAKENEKEKELIKKLKEEENFDELKKITRKEKEFWYLDDLTDTELEQLRTEKIIYIDQGKGNLIYVLNGENERFMKFSSKERRYHLNTKEHTKNTNILMEGYGITEELEKVKDINKKSTNRENLVENTKRINVMNDKIYDKAKRKKLRKEKLEMYIDSQKTEVIMIKKILKQLNIENVNELKTYTLIIGDWHGCNSLKNNQSTQGIGMKRTLKNHVKNMYLIDEYNTSKISNLNFTQTKEHVIEINSISKTGELKLINKKMHGILSFKMNKIRIPCKFKSDLEIKEIRRFIQRDKNAVLNFRTITEHYLNNNRERLSEFKRNIVRT